MDLRLGQEGLKNGRGQNSFHPLNRTPCLKPSHHLVLVRMPRLIARTSKRNEPGGLDRARRLQRSLPVATALCRRVLRNFDRNQKRGQPPPPEQPIEEWLELRYRFVDAGQMVEVISVTSPEIPDLTSIASGPASKECACAGPAGFAKKEALHSSLFPLSSDPSQQPLYNLNHENTYLLFAHQ